MQAVEDVLVRGWYRSLSTGRPKDFLQTPGAGRKERIFARLWVVRKNGLGTTNFTGPYRLQLPEPRTTQSPPTARQFSQRTGKRRKNLRVIIRTRLQLSCGFNQGHDLHLETELLLLSGFDCAPGLGRPIGSISKFNKRTCGKVFSKSAINLPRSW